MAFGGSLTPSSKPSRGKLALPSPSPHPHSGAVLGISRLCGDHSCQLTLGASCLKKVSETVALESPCSLAKSILPHGFTADV